jgi:hypothetical protein
VEQKSIKKYPYPLFNPLFRKKWSKSTFGKSGAKSMNFTE